MNTHETIDGLTQRINGAGTAWLHVEPITTEPGAVAMSVSILRPLGALAIDDSPEAIGDALTELFDGLAAHLRAVASSSASDDDHCVRNAQEQKLASAKDF